MTDKAFVDTNVLIYAHDSSAGVKHDRARILVDTLWQQDAGVLSAQVLQEFCNNNRKKMKRPLPPAELRSVMQDYSRWRVVPNTEKSVLRALDSQDRYRVSFWDALILQAAEEAAVTILYSEDFSHGQYYGSVQVLNPFREL